MSDKHRRRGRRPPHRTATRRSPSRPAGSPAPENPLIGGLREALRAPEPTEFWVAAAPLVTILEDPGELTDALPEGVDLLQSFIDTDIAETTALLHMVDALAGEDLLRARARRALAARRQPVPAHITGLGSAQVSATYVFGDGFGDNHMVELTLPGEVRATMIHYVARAPHLYLKDAFVIAEPLERVQAHFARSMATEGFVLADVLRELEPSQARAALEQALAGIRPDVTKAPEAGDQWPMVRPLVEFALSLMPEGGQGYDELGVLIGQEPSALQLRSGRGPAQPAEGATAHADAPPDDIDALSGFAAMPWLDEDGTDLAERFLASSEASALEADELTGALVRSLMQLADEGAGDPLFWDPALARWVLEEVLPIDPVIPSAAIAQVPTVLPALVAWSHRVTDVDSAMTEAVSESASPLLAALPAGREYPHARARRVEGLLTLAMDVEDPAAFHLMCLAARVGGVEELSALEAGPLPPEPLDLAAIPLDLHERVREIDEQLVAGLDQLNGAQPESDDRVLGAEFLVVCRRFMAQVASREPAVLRRRASSRATAAAIAWILGRGNGLVGYSPAPVRSGDLFRAFEVKSTPGQRAESLMAAAALPQSLENVTLASAGLLVASAREEIITSRDLMTTTE